MSLCTTEGPARSHARQPRTEFAVYFTIIFLAALPLAAAQWLIRAIRPNGTHNRGMFARAWTHAREITPMIFSA